MSEQELELDAEIENEETLGAEIINSDDGITLDTVADIPIQISVVLGRTNMPVNNLLKLSRGAVIELDKNVGEPVDIFVNNRLVARGEVVIVEEKVGVTMTEIVKNDK